MGTGPIEEAVFHFSKHPQQSCLFSESGRDPVGFSFMRFTKGVVFHEMKS